MAVFAVVDLIEGKNFGFFKICYFVDERAFRRLFLGETNSLKMSSLVTAVTSYILCRA